MKPNIDLPILRSYLKVHKGTAHHIKTTFAYHYDQILREILQEIPDKDHELIMDDLIFYMEEVLNYPDTSCMTFFLNDLTGNPDQE